MTSETFRSPVALGGVRTTAIDGHDSEPPNAWPSTQGSLLLRLRRDDDAAWQSFVDVYSPLVYRSCRRRGLQDADARDVTQNVFLRLSKALPRFDYSRESGYFRGWLGTIIRNEVCRHQSKTHQPGNRRSTETRLDEDHAAQSDPWADEFNDYLLQTALTRIRLEFGPDVWKAFELLWIENRSTWDVAAACRRDRQWLYKAKHQVIQRLEQEVRFLCDDAPQLNR